MIDRLIRRRSPAAWEFDPTPKGLQCTEIEQEYDPDRRQSGPACVTVSMVRQSSACRRSGQVRDHRPRKQILYENQNPCYDPSCHEPTPQHPVRACDASAPRAADRSVESVRARRAEPICGRTGLRHGRARRGHRRGASRQKVQALRTNRQSACFQNVAFASGERRRRFLQNDCVDGRDEPGHDGWASRRRREFEPGFAWSARNGAASL